MISKGSHNPWEPLVLCLRSGSNNFFEKIQIYKTDWKDLVSILQQKGKRAGKTAL